MLHIHDAWFGQYVISNVGGFFMRFAWAFTATIAAITRISAARVMPHPVKNGS